MDEYLSPDYIELFNKSTADNDTLRGYPVLPADFTLPDIPSKKGTTSLVQPSVETEQAPGVTTMARANTPLVTSSGRFKLTGETAGNLISEVQKWNTALNSLEITPDGGLKMTSNPPPVQTQQPQGNKEVIGEIRNVSPQPTLTELPAPQPAPESKSFWQKAGEFLTSPTAGYIAGQIGAALATTEGQREFGLSMAKLNLDQVYGQYVNELRKGTSPDELLRGNFKILPAEYRNRAAEEMRLEQEAAMKKEKLSMEKEAFDLDKKSQVIRDKYTEQLTSYQDKLEQGLLTKEEQIEQKNLDRAITLAVGEMNRDDWMGLGGGIAFNFRTGQYVMATTPEGKGQGVPLGKLDTADFNLWEKWVSDNYIKEATEGRKQQYIKEQMAEGKSKKDAENAAKSIDFLNYFKDPKTGMYDPRVIKANLSAARKTEFDKDMAKYLLNAAQGVHPLITQVQQSQQYQINQPFNYTFTGQEDPSKKGQTWEVRAGSFDDQGRATSLIPIRRIDK